MYSSKKSRQTALNFLIRVCDRLGDCKISNADTVRLYLYPVGYVAEIKETRDKTLYCKVDKFSLGLNVDNVVNKIRLVHELVGEVESSLF
jgi:hypothetical protein